MQARQSRSWARHDAPFRGKDRIRVFSVAAAAATVVDDEATLEGSAARSRQAMAGVARVHLLAVLLLPWHLSTLGTATFFGLLFDTVMSAALVVEVTSSSRLLISRENA